jgi:hypothetical protein
LGLEWQAFIRLRQVNHNLRPSFPDEIFRDWRQRSGQASEGGDAVAYRGDGTFSPESVSLKSAHD